MNALLVITPQPAYLEQARSGSSGSDTGAGTEGLRFYVFTCRTSARKKLGPLLQQAVHREGRAGRGAERADHRSGNARRHHRVAADVPAAVDDDRQPQQPAAVATASATSTAAPATSPATAAGARAARATGSASCAPCRWWADKDNNTLLVVATPVEYTVIEAALKKLDVPSRQVMMDVTIAEVTLKDEIDFGVDWLFKGGAPSGRGAGGLLIRSTPVNAGTPGGGGSGHRHRGTTTPRSRWAQGFTYIINNANFPGGIQAVLRLMDTYGNTKVIANPRLVAIATRRRQSSPATGSRSTSRRTPAAAPGQQQLHHHQRRNTLTPACCCRSRPTSTPAGWSRWTCRRKSATRATSTRRGAADQHAVGADHRQRADRADDGSGWPHRRDQAEPEQGPAAAVAKSRTWADCSGIRRSRPIAPSS